METKTINEICVKRDPWIVNMALTLLINKGRENFTEDKVAAELARIEAMDTPNTLIMPELSKSILECADELAKFDVLEILAYVQTDFKIDRVTVHPGVLLEVHDDKGNIVLFRGYLPADTAKDTLEELAEKLESIRENARQTNTDMRNAIPKVLKEIGIPYKPYEPDEIINV